MEMNKNSKIGKQFKSLQFETKDLNYDGESRKISGYAAVFNNKDKAGDILIKGCFAKSINDRGVESNANDKIILLWMHDQHEPIGRITELKEDDHGLYFEAEIDEVERGDQALKQLNSGTLNQFSIGYSYVWDKCEYDNERDAFIVKEVVLYEISVVSIGCNGETEFLGMKSDEPLTTEQINAMIDECCKDMSIKKKEQVQLLARKLLSLSMNKPSKSLESKEAEINENKTIFSNVKFKKNED